MKKLLQIFNVVLLIVLSSLSHAAETNDGDFRSMDESLSELKENVVRLNRDLFILKEQLLFPSNSQVSVFISIDGVSFFSLDSVEVKLDKKTVANHLYTQHEIKALKAGGVHRVFLGNAKSGSHEVTVLFRGIDHHNREIRRAITHDIKKKDQEKFIQVSVVDDKEKQRPDFLVDEW